MAMHYILMAKIITSFLRVMSIDSSEVKEILRLVFILKLTTSTNVLVFLEKGQDVMVIE